MGLMNEGLGTMFGSRNVSAKLTREERRQIYLTRKAARRCIQCTLPARPGKVSCLACARISKDGSRRRYEQRIARGVCVRCAVVPVTKFRMCAGCRRQKAEAAAARKAARN